MKVMKITGMNFDVYDSRDIRVVSQDIPTELLINAPYVSLPTLGEIHDNEDLDANIDTLSHNFKVGCILMNVFLNYFFSKAGLETFTPIMNLSPFFAEDYIDYRSNKGEDYVDVESLTASLAKSKMQSEHIENQIVTSLNFTPNGRDSVLKDGYFYYMFTPEDSNPVMLSVHIEYEECDVQDSEVDIDSMISFLESIQVYVNNLDLYYVDNTEREE